jgi:hypothetical protein
MLSSRYFKNDIQMITIPKISLAIATLLILSQCKKNEPLPASTSTTNPAVVDANYAFNSQNKFTSTVRGRVTTGSTNWAIEGATVTYNGQTATTNELGYYIFTNQMVGESHNAIKVEKAGYFKAFASVAGNSDNVTLANVSLIYKSGAQNFNATTGGSITSNGAEIIFAPNSIVDQNGNAYSGVVSINVKNFDTSVDTDIDQIPGGNMGVDSLGAMMHLSMFGAIGAELRGANNEILNIAPNQTAEIKMDIPADLLAEAQATFPMYHLSEVNGYWEESTTATMVGNQYVAQVPHFSFWACCWPTPGCVLSTNFLCQSSGAVAANTLVRGKRTFGNTYLGSARTNSYGYMTEYVPQNTTITMWVYDPICGGVMFSHQIGPFTSYINNMPNVDACSQGQLVSVTGNLEDCNGNPVVNGYLDFFVTGNGQYWGYPDLNGDVSFLFNGCSYTDADVMGRDLDNDTQSPEMHVSIQPINNMGILSVCDTIQEVLFHSLDGVSQTTIYGSNVDALDLYNSYTSPSGDTSVTLYGFEDNDNHVQFTIENPSVGTFTATDFTTEYLGTGFGNPGNCNIQVTFTEFGHTYQFARGSYSGTFINDADGTTHTASGTFSVIRSH